MADERVSLAFRNWGPRFVVRGVDYGDVVRLSGSIQRWEDWPGAWTEVADEHTALAREWEAAGCARSAGQAWNRAALCHHFGRFLSVRDPGVFRAGSAHAVAALREAHRLLDPTAERIEVDLDGARMAAILRRPAEVRRPPPLVLLIPGLDSTKEEFLLWEDVYLERGMATLSLDGPGQGEGGEGEGRMRPDYEAAIAAVLDRLAGRDDLDLARVGAIGVSLGGYYAPRAASGEPRLRAVVALAGPYELTEFWRHAPAVTQDKVLFHLGVDHKEARERLALFTLAGRAATIRQPMLVVSGRRDRLVPPSHAERLALEAPNARLVMYEHGNHACTNLHWRHTPLEADWLAAQLR